MKNVVPIDFNSSIVKERAFVIFEKFANAIDRKVFSRDVSETIVAKIDPVKKIQIVSLFLEYKRRRAANVPHNIVISNMRAEYENRH